MDDGQRFEELKRELKADIKAVADDVSFIREKLAEADQTPMGRALLRADGLNAKEILELREDFEFFVDKKFGPDHEWVNQQKGSWKALQGAALVLATVGAFFGLLAYWGVRPPGA